MIALASNKLGDRSLKNDVCAEIVGMLHRGELKPGDRVSEALIATRLGISRSPVREAFAQLAHEGVIVRKPRSGNFIVSRTDRELRDIRETRILIECHAARVVCSRFNEEHAGELGELIAAMAVSEQTSNWLEGSRLNALFHQTVVRLAENTTLERVWKMLDPLAWLLAPWSIPERPYGEPDLVSRHSALVDALASGDPDGAAEAFRKHIIEATILKSDRDNLNGNALTTSHRLNQR